jgi:hypothetical protein
MRKLTDHRLNGLNDALDINVLDEAGPGGANHKYMITLPDWTRHPDGSEAHHVWDIDFQKGPIKETGFNGLSNEALLAVVIDRLRGFQHRRVISAGTDSPTTEVFDFNSRGEFACRENAIALTHLEDAMMWLQKRTRDRLARGVEGTNAV